MPSGPTSPRAYSARGPQVGGTDHPGVGHCKRHGGCSPAQVTRARKDIARAEVRRLGLASDEEIPNLDPRTVLAEELYRAERAVREMDRRVGELAEIHGPIFHVSGLPTGERKPHMDWVIWHEERAKLKAVAEACHKAGSETARVQFDAMRAQFYFDWVMRVSGRMGFAGAQLEQARSIAADVLRQLEAADVNHKAP